MKPEDMVKEFWFRDIVVFLRENMFTLEAVNLVKETLGITYEEATSWVAETRPVEHGRKRHA